MNLDTQSKDEIFQVNNLIKNSHINGEDTGKVDSRSQQAGRARTYLGSNMEMNSFDNHDNRGYTNQSRQMMVNSNRQTRSSRLRGEGKYLNRQRNNSMLPSNF